MKNVQVIDGANNCTYSIFGFTDEESRIIFPDEGQDIEFIEDVVQRLGSEQTADLMRPIWGRRMEKETVWGIHGTLFYELFFKKRYYPTKKDSEMITGVGSPSGDSISLP